MGIINDRAIAVITKAIAQYDPGDYVCPACQSVNLEEISFDDDMGSHKCLLCDYVGEPGEDFPCEHDQILTHARILLRSHAEQAALIISQNSLIERQDKELNEQQGKIDGFAELVAVAWMMDSTCKNPEQHKGGWDRCGECPPCRMLKTLAKQKGGV